MKRILYISLVLGTVTVLNAVSQMEPGQDGGGIEKVITPIQRFHTEKMEAGPNVLMHGRWISIQVNSANDITVTPKRGCALKRVSARPVDPLKKDGPMLYVFEAATNGDATIALKNGAVYHFIVPEREAITLNQNSGFVSGVTDSVVR